MALTSDVLFASDEYDLSDDADSVLHSAVAEIASAATEGEVRVVGHADDVPTTSFENIHVLSELRAEAVAARLEELLDGDYAFVAEGRGEDEPRASNSSDEGRAANRRVEIHFDGTLAHGAESGALPETDAAEGPGGEPLQYEGWRVGVESMVRRDGAPVGTLRFDLVEDDALPFHAAISPEPRDEHSNQGRGFGSLSQVISMHAVSLVTAEERLFPYDYELREGEETVIEDDVRRRLLGDEALAWYPRETGQGLLATAVWPDTGQDEVTLELPGRFRLIDVPVTDAAG